MHAKRKSCSWFRPATAAAASAALCGCLMGPDWEEPAAGPEAPGSFREAPADSVLFDVPRADSSAEAPFGDSWWAAWNDPELASLLAAADEANLGVLQAVSRVEQARASLAAARAPLWPSLGASGSGERRRTFDPSHSESSWRAGADASWEIDLFGKNRRAAEASEADFEAAGWSEKDARLSLRAEIAADYVALRLSQTALAIARDNLAAEEENARVARAKGGSGFTSGADVASAEAAIATARASIPAREAAVSAAARAIEKLLALPPFALEDELERPQSGADAFAVPRAPAPPRSAPAE
ncbi:MAG: TolC family protein, partial [Kiritimatiellae bacterium]|nr:TolC family protein [Kiritimatiellia bacterium]